jgi:hypothetical protein
MPSSPLLQSACVCRLRQLLVTDFGQRTVPATFMGLWLLFLPGGTGAGSNVVLLLLSAEVMLEGFEGVFRGCHVGRYHGIVDCCFCQVVPGQAVMGCRYHCQRKSCWRTLKGCLRVVV